MDDKTKTGPADAACAKKFGVTADQLKAAMKKVGVMASDVEAD